jgi:hypothetical protein
MATVAHLVRFKYSMAHVNTLLAAPGLDSSKDIAASHVGEFGLLKITQVNGNGAINGTIVVNHTTLSISNAVQSNGFWS